MAQIVSFTGTGSTRSFDDFLTQFRQLAAINRWPESDLALIMGAYLDGPALAYFKFTYKEGVTFKVICDSLKAEFPSGIDYVEKFYNARQEYKEDIVAFFYRLADYGLQSEISDEKIFIKIFLKGINTNYKLKLGTRLYSSKAELRATIDQIKEIFEGAQPEKINLPLYPPRVSFDRFSAGDRRYSTSPRPMSPGPRASSSTPHRAGDGETFHTPRYNLRPRSRVDSRTNHSSFAPSTRSPNQYSHPNAQGHSR